MIRHTIRDPEELHNNNSLEGMIEGNRTAGQPATPS